MKYFLDTNIFLRVLGENDPRWFEECVNIIRLLESGNFKAYTSSVILSEIAWTLKSQFDFSKKEISESLTGIVNLKGIKFIEDYDHKLALNLYSKNKVKYIDALVASMEPIQHSQMVLVSYDKDFDKLNVARIEPSQVLKQFKKR